MGAAALRQSRWKDVSDRRDIGPLSERHLALASCVDNGKPECVLHPRLWEYFRQCSNNNIRGTATLSLCLSSSLYCSDKYPRFREVDQLSNPFVIDRREDRGAIAFEIDKLEESFSIFTIDRLAASTREISEA